MTADRPRREWSLIGIATASRFGSGILMGTALAVYIGEIGSPFAVSLVASAYWVGLMVLSPVWGAVADVTGRRRAVLGVTGLAATLAVLPLVAVDGIWAPIGFRALYAAFAAGFGPVILSIVSARGGEAARGRSVGFFNSTRAVGFSGGQLTAGVLLGLLVPDQLYLVIAGLSLVSTVAVVLLTDPTPAVEAEPSPGELAAEVKRRLLPAAGERGHLLTNGLLWLYVGLAVRNMTVLGTTALAPPYLVQVVGVSEAVMGGILATNHGIQIVAMLALGVVADRAGRKPLIVAGMAGSGLFALLAAGATLPAPGIGRVLVAGAAFLVLGTSFSAMATGAVSFIGDVAPAGRESELMGLRSTSKAIGGVVGPPLLGIAATLASYEAAFAVGSLLAFGAAVLTAVALVESRPAAAGSAPAGD
ncbi:MAG: MFS transporter [Halobacteriales archaeon]|nr:MFS transporter [Halobacteriales archaeon]